MSSSTREQRKQLLHLLISEISVGEIKNIDTIKIQLNREIVKYLRGKGEKGLSLIDDPFSFSAIYIIV
jgi:site-specific DNA recombinase